MNRMDATATYLIHAGALYAAGQDKAYMANDREGEARAQGAKDATTAALAQHLGIHYTAATELILNHDLNA